jgi:hypothetical protein
MKATLLWNTPKPEMTIGIAMRRCYSTKPIEDIETELEQKGGEYWRYLLRRALEDKSLDVIEHYCFTMLIEEIGNVRLEELLHGFAYVHLLRVSDDCYLMSMNARTLIEMWRSGSSKSFADLVIGQLSEKNVSPIFNSVAFGDGNHAS